MPRTPYSDDTLDARLDTAKLFLVMLVCCCVCISVAATTTPDPLGAKWRLPLGWLVAVLFVNVGGVAVTVWLAVVNPARRSVSTSAKLVALNVVGNAVVLPLAALVAAGISHYCWQTNPDWTKAALFASVVAPWPIMMNGRLNLLQSTAENNPPTRPRSVRNTRRRLRTRNRITSRTCT